MPLSVAAACSSKLNERQNRLRSARPHARLMRAPNGACSTSCMPPPSSKNRSATTVLMRRQRAERRRARAHVEHSLLRAAPVEPALAASATRCRRHRRRRRSRISARSSDTALDSSNVRPGASPRQNGIVGAAPCASSTRTRPASTRRMRHDVVPEQEHVAGHALDREVFVERADDRFVRLGDHEVLRVVRNRAARRDRRQPRAAPAAHDAVHAIAMQKRAAAAALGADALRQHVDHGVEIRARQIA